MSTTPPEERPPPAPPRVVAISGMIFAGLYIASLVLVRLAVPADPREPGAWLADPTLGSGIRFALNVIPFTGIAFLWFMGVLRNRIGGHEDRFFATVFLGSGLLFVAMLFVAAAVFQGLLAAFAKRRQASGSERNLCLCPGGGSCTDEHVRREDGGRVYFRDFLNRYADRGFPRWMVFVGYA